MKIIRPPQQSLDNDYIALLRNKYGERKNFDFFEDDARKAWNFCITNDKLNFYPLAGHADGKLEAHAALIIDKRLPAGEAFFGFMEFPDNDLIFKNLWNALVTEAREKGITVLRGPVNGSIWHQYRCLRESDGSDFFKAEPMAESYYYNYLVSNKPFKQVDYISAYRKPFDIVLRFIDKKALEKMTSLGFTIKEINCVDPGILGDLAKISKAVFSQSWGYTELTLNEFMELYTLDKMASHLGSLYLLYKGSTVIGFCSTSQEDEETLICKTIALLPEYQGLGLGNALAYQVHQDATARGYKKMIYALIREGNNIKNFPQEQAVIFRKYAAFEFNL
ncbi:MAG: GNAT family N-acetyltransferase [Candidatus Paceibacterota bacterium]